MDLVTWYTFVVTIFALIVIPGPTGMNQVRLALTNPLKKCVISALGATTVSNTYIILVFLFLSQLKDHLNIINYLQIFGICYIFYTAYKILKTSFVFDNHDQIQTVEMSNFKMYLSGASVAVSNPKDIIFFISFLPLFVKAFSFGEYLAVALTWTVYDVGFSVIYSAIARKAALLSDKFAKIICVSSSIVMYIIGIAMILHIS